MRRRAFYSSFLQFANRVYDADDLVDFPTECFRSCTMDENEVICDRATALEILCTAAAIEQDPPSRGGAQQPVVATQKRSKLGASRRSRSKGRQRPCQCRLCRACVSNARWERVFNEKFADVEYYGGMRLSHRSPLGDF
jgi:hypothetical protein